MANPIYVDLHVHTHFSPCGEPEATAEAMIRRAQEMGLAALGFADHCTPQPVPGSSFYAHQRPDIVDKLRDEIAQVNGSPDIEVWVGIEADYALAGPACLDATVRSKADHIICSSSHLNLQGAPQPAADTGEAWDVLLLRLAREAIVVPGILVWVHPFSVLLHPMPPILETATDDDLAELIALANAHEVALEINGSAARREPYRQATARFFRLARDMGARFTITADAHHPDDFVRLDQALAWATAMGLRDDDFLTLAELRERRRRKLGRGG